MQIKTTLRHHFSPIRLAKIQKLTITLCWQGRGGKQTLSYTAFSLGMQNGITPMDRSLAISNKIHSHLHFDMPVSLLGINPEDSAPIIQKKKNFFSLHKVTHCSIIRICKILETI